MKLLQFCLFVLVYSLSQATASPLTDCWFWEDADPDPGNPPSIRTTTCNPPTSKPPVTTTDRNQEYKNCVQKCPTTPEYNPVCGTNSVTYDNESKLNCARRCGIRVYVLFYNPCNDQTTTATTPSDLRGCIGRCPSTSEYNPVCGTDGQIYSNESKMKCAKWCGVKVERQYLGACDGKKPLTTSTTSKPNSLSPKYASCIRRCSISSAVKLVCGTDGVTYENESEIWCDFHCGRDVQKLRDGPCM